VLKAACLGASRHLDSNTPDYHLSPSLPPLIAFHISPLRHNFVLVTTFSSLSLDRLYTTLLSTMSSISSYTLLQEFHSRPPPVPFSLINSNINQSIYPDANTTLLNLACKTAQNRRRKQGHASSNSLQLQGSSSSFAPLSSDQPKVQRVYSEVMMSSDSAPPSLFVSTTTTGCKQGGTSIDSSTCKRTPSLRKQIVRHRPISPEGISLSSDGDAKEPQNRRGRILGQMMQNPIAIKQFKKPVNLSLVQNLPQASAVHVDDEDDEDWAAFIAKGYGDFPLPPAHISPASTIMSGSTFLSPSTCATSLPSSDHSKTGEAWPDNESAWASEDEDEDGRDLVIESNLEEEQEVVKSPLVPVSELPTRKRYSNLSGLSYTSSSSPQKGVQATSRAQEKVSPSLPRLTRESSSCERKVPSIQVYDEEPSTLPSTNLQRSRSVSKLMRLLGEDSMRSHPRQASSSISSIGSSDTAYSSLAYLSTDTNPTKGQSTASKICNRLASRMNRSYSHRTSTPDVPVTPRSASSDLSQAQQDRNSLSPSCAIFGSAAINARASAYAAMAASMLSSDQASLRSSTSSLQSSHQDGLAAVPKAGFCFDYDPRSPLFLSSAEVTS
jgi:hypothetical protein